MGQKKKKAVKPTVKAARQELTDMQVAIHKQRETTEPTKTKTQTAENVTAFWTAPVTLQIGLKLFEAGSLFTIKTIQEKNGDLVFPTAPGDVYVLEDENRKATVFEILNTDGATGTVSGYDAQTGELIGFELIDFFKKAKATVTGYVEAIGTTEERRIDWEEAQKKKGFFDGKEMLLQL